VTGAAWGFIPGALKAWTGAHEVVTTIMLNYIAGNILAAFVVGPLRVPRAPRVPTDATVSRALARRSSPSRRAMCGASAFRRHWRS